MAAVALGSVPARLEYQGYLTDTVGTAIDCQGCAVPYNFKFSIYDQQVDGTQLWSELHAGIDVIQGVFHLELGVEEILDAELLEEPRWLEIQINDQAPMIPRQRIIAVPYALRASVAEHAIESENAASLGGQPVENFMQVGDTDGFLAESELGDVLDGLGYVPGDNDSLADLNTCAADEILKWDGSAWSCGADLNSDPLSTLLCAGGEIAQWDGSAWSCSAALDAVQANVDQVQTNVDQVQANVDQVQTNVDQVQVNLDALDASLDPVAKAGLPADLADGDDNSQLSEAEVLNMVSGAGYVTGDHFSGDWGDLSGVPADILDGDADTDTLATLGCSTGQVPEWNGSVWTCGAGGQWIDSGSYLAANNAPNVVITDTGRVGIGTSAPGALTHMYKPALSLDSTPLEMLRLEVEDTGVDMNPGHGPAITFYVGETSGSDHGGTVAVVRESDSDVDSASAMVFHTAIDDTYPAERMRISSTGNVGIGTTDPVTRLEVAGGVKMGNSGVCDASTAGTIRWNGTAFEGCNGTDWQSFATGGGGPPESVMYLRKYNGTPVDCPAGWTSVAVGSHFSGGYWNHRRVCRTEQSCSVLYIDKYNGTPSDCPAGWTSVDVGNHFEGGYWNYRRVCTLCD